MTDVEFITREESKQLVLDGKVVFFHHLGIKARITADTTTKDLRDRHFGQFNLTMSDIINGKYSVAPEPTPERYMEFAKGLHAYLTGKMDYTADIQDSEVVAWLIEQAKRTKSLQEQLDAKIVFVNNGWEEERYALQEESIHTREALLELQQSLRGEFDGDLSKEMKTVLWDKIEQIVEGMK